MLHGGYIKKLGSSWSKKKRNVSGRHGLESSAGNSGLIKPAQTGVDLSSVPSMRATYLGKGFNRSGLTARRHIEPPELRLRGEDVLN